MGRYGSPSSPPPAHDWASPQPAPAKTETQRPEQPSWPVPQVQPHQVVRTSETEGIPMERAVFVPQGNQVVQPTAQVMHGEQVVRPTEHMQSAPRADVTVILYSGGQDANLLSQQLEALRRQTVTPAAIWCHVDGSLNHDEKTLSKLTVCRTTVKLGRYFRLELARSVPTKWVAVLDEDTLPGERWLANALGALEAGDRAMQSTDGSGPEFGPGVVAAAGSTVQPGGQNRFAGPEMPREGQEFVTFGRQGWVFAPEFARIASSMPRGGIGPTAFGMVMGAAAWSVGAPTVVLPYGMDRSNWGSLTQARVPEPTAHDADVQGTLLVHHGWQPGSDPPTQGVDGEEDGDRNEPGQESPLAPAQEPEVRADPLPGVSPDGWKEKTTASTTTREKVLSPEESRALSGED